MKLLGGLGGVRMKKAKVLGTVYLTSLLVGYLGISSHVLSAAPIIQTPANQGPPVLVEQAGIQSGEELPQSIWVITEPDDERICLISSRWVGRPFWAQIWQVFFEELCVVEAGVPEGLTVEE